LSFVELVVTAAPNMREVERHRTPRRVGDEIEVSQFKEITAPQITNRIVA
jgi:hypothetical protein